jgi:uncharacterized protein (DUF924 family)
LVLPLITEVIQIMLQPAERQLITTILDYWFSDIGEGFELRQQHKRWYSGDTCVDQHIKQHFAEIFERAVDGHLSHWAVASGSVSSLMALVIVLDQFGRNIYRGSARAFSGDVLARAVVNKGLQQGLDQRLSYMQRSFFYMPLEHSESLADQHRGVELFEQLWRQAPAEGKATIKSSLDFAIRHRKIIARFGRFPHRNQVLGRASTDEEQAYLDGGGARFGQ